MFPKLTQLLNAVQPVHIPLSWKAEKIKSEVDQCFASKSSVKEFIKIIFLFATCLAEKEDRTKESFRELFSDLLRILRNHILNGSNVDILFQQISAADVPNVIARAMRRLEIGINWSGVFPEFRDARNGWLTAVGEAKTLPQQIVVWKQFEAFCNWENLGKAFLGEPRTQWLKKLEACDSDIKLIELVLEMESYCVDDRLSGIYRSDDRLKWRSALQQITRSKDIPSLQAICAKKIVVGEVSRDMADLPGDVLDLIDDMDLVWRLIKVGADTLQRQNHPFW